MKVHPRGSGETRAACPAGRVNALGFAEWLIWGGWVEDADDWYAAMVVILAERAPA